MRFKQGDHAGETYEEVLLKSPDFAQVLMSKYADGVAAKELRRLARAFDKKRFTAKCEECGKRAKRASALGDSSVLEFWCDKHHPVTNKKAQIVEGIEGLLKHVDAYGNGKVTLKRKIVRNLAEAKGLPKKVGEEAALEFFES